MRGRSGHHRGPARQPPPGRLAAGAGTVPPWHPRWPGLVHLDDPLCPPASFVI